jgi:hypothetical protein
MVIDMIHQQDEEVNKAVEAEIWPNDIPDEP